MKPDKHRHAKPTAADIEAAKALRDIWLGRNQKPSQPFMAKNWNGAGAKGLTQGAISQYINGKAPLNLKAVLKFASFLECDPRSIRRDLPELAIPGRMGYFIKEPAPHSAERSTDWPFAVPRARFEDLPRGWKTRCDAALLEIIGEWERSMDSSGSSKGASGTK